MQRTTTKSCECRFKRRREQRANVRLVFSNPRHLQLAIRSDEEINMVRFCSARFFVVNFFVF